MAGKSSERKTAAQGRNKSFRESSALNFVCIIYSNQRACVLHTRIQTTLLCEFTGFSISQSHLDEDEGARSSSQDCHDIIPPTTALSDVRAVPFTALCETAGPY